MGVMSVCMYTPLYMHTELHLHTIIAQINSFFHPVFLIIFALGLLDSFFKGLHGLAYDREYWSFEKITVDLISVDWEIEVEE